MLGLDNTGKTCTAKSLVGESMDLVAPTVGFSKETTKYKGFRINIFDLGGSKRYNIFGLFLTSTENKCFYTKYKTLVYNHFIIFQ